MLRFARFPNANKFVWQQIRNNSKKPIFKVKNDAIRKKSFEFPPNPNSGIPDHVRTKSNNNFWIRHKKHIPIVVSVLVGGWSFYTIYHFMNPGKVSNKNNRNLLSPDDFTEFLISNKKIVDDEHFIIELTPKETKNFGNKPVFNGSKLWSVEVKQPEIMVVRKYTPIPLMIENVNNDQILRINPQNDGKFCLYIKRYDQGEVSRWLSKLSLGSPVELRGPYTEYEFEAQYVDQFKVQRPSMTNLLSKVETDRHVTLKTPAKSFEVPSFLVADNIAFFAAGTGIAPFLQLTLSDNPYKGRISLFYSFKQRKEIPPEFEKMFYFLEKLGRAKVTMFDESKNEYLSLKNVPSTGTKASDKFQVSVDSEKREKYLKEKMIEAKMKQLKSNANANTETETDTETETRDKEIELFKNKPKNDNELAKLANLEIPTASSGVHQAFHFKDYKLEDPVLALVCGPDGYVEYVAGQKINETQGEFGGLLKAKNWSANNVYKM